MSLSSLIIFSARSNLLLKIYSIFFIFAVFISRSSIWVFFYIFHSLLNMFKLLFIFLNLQNRVMLLFCSCSLILSPLQFLCWFVLIFIFIIGHVSSFLECLVVFLFLFFVLFYFVLFQVYKTA